MGHTQRTRETKKNPPIKAGSFLKRTLHVARRRCGLELFRCGALPPARGDLVGLKANASRAMLAPIAGRIGRLSRIQSAPNAEPGLEQPDPTRSGTSAFIRTQRDRQWHLRAFPSWSASDAS